MQTEQLIGLAVLAVAAAIVVPYAIAWPIWAQITAGAVALLLIGLLNGVLRALAEQ